MTWQWCATVAIIGIVYAVWCRRLEKDRTHKLDRRDEVNIDHWLKQNHPGIRYAHEAKNMVRDAMAILGRACGVAPNKLRPTDRFGKELSLNSLALDETWADALAEIQRKVLQDYGLRWAPPRALQSVGDLLSSLVSRLE